ncbi:hypothetical protein BD408DRAFT_415576 [Parasitella parasitica]|nr:hypothetical protein BD408DRAFT_415576 [Parasitella parasitica]
MFVISREQAICLFYAVPYNKENAEKYTKTIDEMEDITICYSENPKQPFLCSLKSMIANPSEYNAILKNNSQEKEES